MIINSESEMLKFGESFAKKIDLSNTTIIELVGDIGAGKTTFVRGLAKGLHAATPITSPSFTISKIYALPNGYSLIHYDFYRLKSPGLMTDDLKENLDNPNSIIIVEWGNTVTNILPENRIIINIKRYNRYTIFFF